MALKKSTKTSPIHNAQEERETRIAQLRKELSDLTMEADRIDREKVKVRNHIAAIQLFPFKAGDIVLCEITSGRRREEKKCVIEVEDGIVYVRPYKNGTEELSGRHFSVTLIAGQSYTTVFKKV